MYLDYTPPPSRIVLTPEGRGGVLATLKAMRDLVRGEQGKKNPRIRQLAVELVKYVPKNDMRGRIANIWEYVRGKIKYVRDITDVETLHWPNQIIAQEAGDCDDQAVLVAALLESVGIPTAFKAVGFVPGQLSHVYAMAKIGDKWLALETTENVKLGWQPPNIRDQIFRNN